MQQQQRMPNVQQQDEEGRERKIKETEMKKERKGGEKKERKKGRQIEMLPLVFRPVVVVDDAYFTRRLGIFRK